MQQDGAAGASGERHVLRPEGVVPRGERRIRLARVHLGVCGEVHDRVGTERRDRLEDCGVIADIELGVRERMDLMMLGRLREERPRETSTRPRDDQPHRPVPAARGSVTTGASCASRSQTR